MTRRKVTAQPLDSDDEEQEQEEEEEEEGLVDRAAEAASAARGPGGGGGNLDRASAGGQERGGASAGVLSHDPATAAALASGDKNALQASLTMALPKMAPLAVACRTTQYVALPNMARHCRIWHGSAEYGTA